MSFRLADVKKTVRTRGDGERYVHPKLLGGVATLTQIELALAYFNSRLGRARSEVDPETLIRFFGDAKVARGVIAALGDVYRWRAQEFAEVLDARPLAALAAKGLATPSDLRLYLFDAVNRHGDGFLAAEREEHLLPLARRLRLTPAKLDQLVALDAQENAVLVRVGPVPEAAHVVALYNCSVVDSLLRNSVYIELGNAGQAARTALESACGQYGLTLSWRGEQARLENQADAFGSYARTGRRFVRALYSALGRAPGLLAPAQARVQMPHKTALFELGKEVAAALTGRTGRVYQAALEAEVREAWDRQRASEGTAGWRLSVAPEPLLTPAGLVLAPAVCQRQDTRVTLWPVNTLAALNDVVELQAAGLHVLAVVSAELEPRMPPHTSWSRESDGAAGIVAALATQWGGERVHAAAQALESLLAEVAQRGFIPVDEVVTALGCASSDEVPARLAGLDAAGARYVEGLGLCSATFAAEMRRGLRRGRRGRKAA